MLINPGTRLYIYAPKVTILNTFRSYLALLVWRSNVLQKPFLPVSYCRNSGDPRLRNTQHGEPSSSCLRFHPRRFFGRLHFLQQRLFQAGIWRLRAAEGEVSDLAAFLGTQAGSLVRFFSPRDKVSRKDGGFLAAAIQSSFGSHARKYTACTDKKENEIFLIFKEMQMGSVAKSYMRKGFLIYIIWENAQLFNHTYMRKLLVI